MSFGRNLRINGLFKPFICLKTRRPMLSLYLSNAYCQDEASRRMYLVYHLYKRVDGWGKPAYVDRGEDGAEIRLACGIK